MRPQRGTCRWLFENENRKGGVKTKQDVGSKIICNNGLIGVLVRVIIER